MRAAGSILLCRGGDALTGLIILDTPATQGDAALLPCALFLLAFQATGGGYFHTVLKKPLFCGVFTDGRLYLHFFLRTYGEVGEWLKPIVC